MRKKRQLQNSLVLAFKLNSLLTDQIGKLSLYNSVAFYSSEKFLVFRSGSVSENLNKFLECELCNQEAKYWTNNYWAISFFFSFIRVIKSLFYSEVNLYECIYLLLIILVKCRHSCRKIRVNRPLMKGLPWKSAFKTLAFTWAQTLTMDTMIFNIFSPNYG